MSRSRQNFILGLLLIGLCLSPFVGLSAESQADVFNLEIRERKIVGEMTTVRVTQGHMVTLRWRTDEAVSLHLHGYDIETVVKPETPAEVSFKAFAAGRFPITAHGFGAQGHGGGHEETTLLYLEVHPR